MNNNIFFIFCHQDDEFGLFNVIENATKKQKNVFVIYLTSGLINKNQNIKNKLLQRDKESLNVLLRLGVKRNNIFFLGKKLNIPIYYLYKYLIVVYRELNKFLKKYPGKKTIYTHSWEGGNEDHDACFLIIKKIIHHNLKTVKAYEFSQYHNFKSNFLPYKVQSFILDKKKIYKTKVKFINKIRYIYYLFNYASQLYIWLPIFPFVIIRILMNDYGNLKMISKNLSFKKPHSGKLLYEKLRTKKYTYFKKYFLNFLFN
jgi:LmbE family N-acetylglucosaminyl deacetylase